MKTDLTDRRIINADKMLQKVLQQRIPDVAPNLSSGEWEPLGRSGLQIDLWSPEYGQYHFTLTFDTGSDTSDDYSLEQNFVGTNGIEMKPLPRNLQ